MKLLMILLTFFQIQSAFSRDEYQLGVIVGAPTGISAKFGLGNNRSIDGALAYSLADNLGLELHADYILENVHAFNVNAASPLQLFLGIGARIVSIDRGRHDGDLALGPRAPIGLNYKMVNPNLEFFGELALCMDLIPNTNADLEGGMGLRYRF